MGGGGEAARRMTAGTARRVRSLICGFSSSVVGRLCQRRRGESRSADGRRVLIRAPRTARDRPSVLEMSTSTTHRLSAWRWRPVGASLPPPTRLGKSPPTLQPPSRILSRAVCLRGGASGLRPHRIDPAPEVAERSALGLGDPGHGRLIADSRQGRVDLPPAEPPGDRGSLLGGPRLQDGGGRGEVGLQPGRRPARASAPGSGRRAGSRVGRSSAAASAAARAAWKRFPTVGSAASVGEAANASVHRRAAAA